MPVIRFLSGIKKILMFEFLIAALSLLSFASVAGQVEFYEKTGYTSCFGTADKSLSRDYTSEFLLEGWVSCDHSDWGCRDFVVAINNFFGCSTVVKPIKSVLFYEISSMKGDVCLCESENKQCITLYGNERNLNAWGVDFEQARRGQCNQMVEMHSEWKVRNKRAVCVYDKANFEGREICSDTGFPDLSGYNLSISSYRLLNGAAVRFIGDNAHRTEFDFLEEAAEMKGDTDNFFRGFEVIAPEQAITGDNFSPDASKWICAYSGTNYEGLERCKTYTNVIGTTNINTFFAGIGKIRSVRLGENTAITLSSTKHDNKWTYYTDTPNILSNVASNITHFSFRSYRSPSASRVEIAGVEMVGGMLEGKYHYYHPLGIPESDSFYQWYRANDSEGNGQQLIGGASNKRYIASAADQYKFLKFCVMPSIYEYYGDLKCSDWSKPLNEDHVNVGFDQALEFNDLATYVDLPVRHNLQDESFSVSGWFKLGELNREQVLLSVHDNLNWLPLLSLNSQNRLCVSLSNNVLCDIESTRALQLNKWYSVAIVQDHALSVTTLYINGNENASADLLFNRTTNGFRLGRSNSDDSAFLGAVDELKFWGAALSRAQIKIQQYLTDIDRHRALAYYSMNDGGGNIVLADSSENRVHGSFASDHVVNVNWIDSEVVFGNQTMTIETGRGFSAKLPGAGNGLKYFYSNRVSSGELRTTRDGYVNYEPTNLNERAEDYFYYLVANSTGRSAMQTVRIKKQSWATMNSKPQAKNIEIFVRRRQLIQSIHGGTTVARLPEYNVSALQVTDSDIEVSFDYVDADGDANTRTEIQWYWVEEGGDKKAISGENSMQLGFSLGDQHEHKALTVCISVRDGYEDETYCRNPLTICGEPDFEGGFGFARGGGCGNSGDDNDFPKPPIVGKPETGDIIGVDPDDLANGEDNNYVPLEAENMDDLEAKPLNLDIAPEGPSGGSSNIFKTLKKLFTF